MIPITKNSKWKRTTGQILEVVGIWAQGGGENYRPVQYELKNSVGEIKPVDAALFRQQIEEGKLKKCN